MKRVLVISGSSGGHIFPALAFLDSLRESKEIEALLVLPKKNILNLSGNHSYQLRYISVTSLRPGLSWSNLLACVRFFQGTLESAGLLLSFRPHIVVGFGSIVSVAMILLARILGIKTLIHEQNVIPGRANRFLAKFADSIAISFIESSSYFTGFRNKIILTGNPLRPELISVDKARGLDFFDLKPGKFTILVIGGSQASKRVNAAFLQALVAIADKAGLQVIHLSGALELGRVERAYKELGVTSRCFAFLDKMQYAYSCSDLVISRAGATTISEIIFFELATVLIPYPYAYRHQLANAKALENIGAALIVEEDALETGMLTKVIKGFLDNPERIRAMRSSYAHLKKIDARGLFREAVLSLN
ncbi:MAG: undecaprenyldiphospho-muramoylpentapeptide beta-N-acetylglucosaminyltransferase [Candidatus Omnitrophota bacterium]